MDFKEMYHHIFHTGRQMLQGPGEFWEGKKGDETSVKIFVNFFLPLVLLVALGIFMGELITSPEFLFEYAIAKSLREIAGFTLEYLLSVFVLNELVKTFGGIKDMHATSRLMAYSLLPALAAAFVTGLFPGLYVLNVFGLYGAVLFVFGVKGNLQLPAENKTRYIMIAFLLIILIFMIVNIFSWKILQALY
jgi:hypothetical protein